MSSRRSRIASLGTILQIYKSSTEAFRKLSANEASAQTIGRPGNWAGSASPVILRETLDEAFYRGFPGALQFGKAAWAWHSRRASH